jgi:hypothetical protein
METKLSRYSEKRKRRKYLLELARQSILDKAPKPITKQEIHDNKWINIMRGLIMDTKKALYRSPGEATKQKKYNSQPENDRSKLREPYRQLDKADKVF